MKEKTAIEALKKCRILVTATTFGRCEPSPIPELESLVGEVVYNPFNRPLKADELIPLVNDIDGIIAGLDEINASVIKAANRLKVIARYGVGVDRVDVAEATRAGIVVTNTPGSNSVAVAELTICLMLGLARKICFACASTKKGEWPRIDGVGLKGKTVGIIGFGSIGKEVAKRLNAFECCILAYDPNVSNETASKFHAELVLLDELLARSDFVTLHVSLTPQTTGMVDAQFLKKMKRGAFLINTARGELIDEVALVDAIKDGHLRGAGLDCFSIEPPIKDNPLLFLPQVIVTPHTGAHTDEAIYRMSRMSMDNCLAVLKGERPANPVNPEVYNIFEGKDYGSP
ncbi:MAG: phosphoglycerate dehydrogenase [Syntrophorhabdaceae bacterium]|nr:phosphoglycerate dehydrogenase [Syntrophorhabdaceae bacterium]